MIHKSVLLTSLAGARQLCYMARKEKDPKKLKRWLKELDTELDFIWFTSNNKTVIRESK